MRKSSRKSAKLFHEKDATLIDEKVCILKQLVGVGEKRRLISLLALQWATPSESRIRKIRSYGSMRGRRSKDLLLLCEVGADLSSYVIPRY